MSAGMPSNGGEEGGGRQSHDKGARKGPSPPQRKCHSYQLMLSHPGGSVMGVVYRFGVGGGVAIMLVLSSHRHLEWEELASGCGSHVQSFPSDSHIWNGRGLLVGMATPLLHVQWHGCLEWAWSHTYLMFSPLQLWLTQGHLQWQGTHHWAWLNGWILQPFTQDPPGEKKFFFWRTYHSAYYVLVLAA